MSKYLYRIMHLPIQRYLKWWLEKYAQSKEVDYNKTFYLGMTEQYTTTGANLQKFTARESSQYNFNIDDEGQLTLTGTQSSENIGFSYNISTNSMSLNAGTYTLKVIGTIDENTRINAFYNGSEHTLTLNSEQEATIILSSNVDDYRTMVRSYAGQHNSNFYLTLASGSTATLERYTRWTSKSFSNISTTSY